MEDPHPLKSLLQLQLASDQSSVLHLPHILESTLPEHLLPSAHTQKWTTRISSLLHSKDAATRWSGLCIALRTAICSRSLMLECAQGWIGVALPLLSKEEENVVTLKAAIRLLRYIFSSVLDVPEFQRQVCVINMPKASTALIALAGKRPEQELKLLAMATLTHLIPLYPTLHRSLHGSLTSLTLKFLNGSSPKPTPVPLMKAASQLYSVLHVTGGKVGGANLWRKAVDDTLAFAWGAFYKLTTTHPSLGRRDAMLQSHSSTEDPVVIIPLNVDRLRAAVHIICGLLQTLTPRPVVVPVGPLMQLCLTMLRALPEEKAEGHLDPTVRAMEVSVIPTIWGFGCDLVEALSESMGPHLTPHLPQLASHLSYHLEQRYTPVVRLSFLQATASLLSGCSYLHDTVLSSRLARAILPSLTILLATQSQAQASSDAVSAKGKSKRGKKRARGYEGDELLRNSVEIMCQTAEEEHILLVALDALRNLLRNANIVSAIHSIVSRVLLAIYISLPLVQPSLISPDILLHGKLYVKICDMCSELASGTSSTMSKSLGLIVGTMNPDHHNTCGGRTLQDIELLLHPRVPPLVRPLPHVETLSLFREEEGDEEAGARKSLGLGTTHSDPLQTVLPSAPLELPPPAHDRVHRYVAEAPAPRVVEPITAQQEPARPPVPAMQSIAISSPPMHVPAANPISSAPGANMHAMGGSPVPPLSGPVQPQNTFLSPASSSVRPSSSVAPPSTTAVSVPLGSSTASLATRSPRTLAIMDQDDDDEPMPTIDLESDSDG